MKKKTKINKRQQINNIKIPVVRVDLNLLELKKKWK